MLGIGTPSSLVFFCSAERDHGNLDSAVGLAVIFVWLFAVILGSVTCVVRMRIISPFGLENLTDVDL